MRPKNNKLIKLLAVVLILVLAINMFFIIKNFNIIRSINKMPIQQENKVNEEIDQLKLNNDPLSLKDFTKVFVSVKDTAIQLENNCTTLLVQTNEYQAYSIQEAIKSRIDIRPTTHDIMENVLKDFNITLLQAKIVEFKDPHFLSRTVYKQGNKIFDIDTKTSDAVALALRMDVPVYVKNSIFYNNGKKVC